MTSAFAAAERRILHNPVRGGEDEYQENSPNRGRRSIAFAIVGGIALAAAQDRYTLQVPGGLAFSEFKGYEDWQVISVSHNGDKVALIVEMIEAYKAGIPGSGKPFPDGARMAKTHWVAKKLEDQPGEPIAPGALHDVDFRFGTDSEKQFTSVSSLTETQGRHLDRRTWNDPGEGAKAVQGLPCLATTNLKKSGRTAAQTRADDLASPPLPIPCYFGRKAEAIDCPTLPPSPF